MKRYEEAFTTFKSLTDEGTSSIDPAFDISAAWNNLGVIQIRRGATPETGTPAFFLTKAADVSPADSDVLFNLGYAYMLERNTQAATYWLREAVRRGLVLSPAEGDLDHKSLLEVWSAPRFASLFSAAASAYGSARL